MSTRQMARFPQEVIEGAEWMLGIIGAIAAFMGLFVLFGADEHYVGLGGTASWRVGDIAAAWGYGLVALGLVLALLVGALVRWDHTQRSAGVRAVHSSRAGVLVHAIVFLLVNSFLWAQDVAIGDGLNYAYWTTIPWGVGLAAHAVSAFTGGGERTSTR